MRVSVYLEHLPTLTDLELLRVINAIDSEVARCKVVAKSNAAPTTIRFALIKIDKLKKARELFSSEQNTRSLKIC